jgi:peptidyl-prolyl cis-trans isomerase B (cyclophilin B)
MNRAAQRLMSLLFTALVIAPTLGAQGSSKPAPSDRNAKALRVVLTPEGRYARSEDPFFLQVGIEVQQPSAVDFGLLDGSKLQLFVDKTELGPLLPAPEGAEQRKPWRLGAGAAIQLRLPLDIESILERYSLSTRPGKVHRLSVQAMGDKATRSEFVIVCRPSALTVADLDLPKTRVALVTNFGTMLVGLRPDKAPKTAENFVKLANQGFYDGTRFHRVVQNFMIQGGDPNTKDSDPSNDGAGGPGYKIPDEFSDLTHQRGVLSMANLGSPNTGGSQFFVMHARRPDLDGRYAAFGQLVEGLDTLDRIAAVPTIGQMRNPRERSRPTTDVTLVRAVVVPTLR